MVMIPYKNMVMIQYFRIIPKKSNCDYLWWKEMPSKETEEVYRAAHKLLFQLNPVEDGLANSSFRAHWVGQALTGPKRLSKISSSASSASSASSENWYPWNGTNVTNRTHWQRSLKVHMQDVLEKLFIKIINSGVYQQWFFRVTIISFS